MCQLIIIYTHALRFHPLERILYITESKCVKLHETVASTASVACNTCMVLAYMYGNSKRQVNSNGNCKIK